MLTLHLHQELCLDPASCLALILTPGAAQRVNLVNEDDGWPMLSGQLKQILHQPNGISQSEVQVIICHTCSAVTHHPKPVN